MTNEMVVDIGDLEFIYNALVVLREEGTDDFELTQSILILASYLNKEDEEDDESQQQALELRFED